MENAVNIIVRFTLLGGEPKILCFPSGTSRNDILTILRDSYLLSGGHLLIDKTLVTDRTNIDGKEVDFEGFTGIYYFMYPIYHIYMYTF